MSLFVEFTTPFLSYIQVQSLNIIPAALMMILLNGFFKKKYPQIIFILWILLLLRLLLPVEYGVMSPLPRWISTANVPSEVFSGEEIMHYPFYDTLNLDLSQAGSENIYQLPLFMLWCAGLSISLARLLLWRRKLARQPKAIIHDISLLNETSNLQKHFGIQRRIQIYRAQSNQSDAYTTGSLVPRIIIPCEVHPKSETLRAMLAHECAHIARWDDLFILFSQFVMSIFFFHPLVWMARKMLIETREMAVDRMVLTHEVVGMRDYAFALINTASRSPQPGFSLPFSAKKRFLKNRLLAMKGITTMKMRNVILITLITIPLLSISWVLPQSDQTSPSEQEPGFILPVDGARLTSSFGKRMHPIKKKELDHGGIDLAGKTGTPVMATANGIISSAKFEKGWGNTIRMEHEGKYASVYAQLDKILVQVNQTVKQGDIIGQVGSSGNSTGPHLHFEIRHNGKRVNPADFIDL